MRRTIQCSATDQAKTATFGLHDACFPAKDLDFDFEIRAAGQGAPGAFWN